MITVTDQCNREVSIIGSPKRIISLVPSQTELLHDLGLEDEVIGLTKFCVHPKEWHRTKIRVGGTKSIHLEKIKGLSPDLIIANKEENTREEIEEIAKYFPVWVSDIKSLEDALQMIESLGSICQRKKKAESISMNIRAGFSQLSSIKNNSSCLYFIWQKPYMLAGSQTFISEMLSKCGFSNLAEGMEGRYPEITHEEIKKLRPDYILLSSEPFPFKEKHKNHFKESFPDSIPILVDGEMFSWYGSRLQYAPEYFKKLFKNVEKYI